MTLFNTTGFEIEDRVFVILNDIKYFGTVVDTDDRLDRVKVDYTGKYSANSAVSWFHKSFWEK